MSNIHDLQAEHRVWVQHNFPGQPPWHPLLGLVEEVGELSHAYLKAAQGIRQNEGEPLELIEDAVGDIFIYLMSFCNALAIDAEEVIHKTWNSVRMRDWIKYPKTGKPDSEPSRLPGKPIGCLCTEAQVEVGHHPGCKYARYTISDLPPGQ